MTDRLQANMAAAKMLGREREFFCPSCGSKMYALTSHFGCTNMSCMLTALNPVVRPNIFTNPSDCLAAVKCLLKDGWNIRGGTNGSVEIYSGDKSFRGKDLPDATAAACIEVMKG